MVHPSPGPVITLDPLLGADDAAEMLAIRSRFGGHGMYSEEGSDTGYAPGLKQRQDTLYAYFRDREGSGEPIKMAAARTNYFRETYAYGDAVNVDGIESFMHHPGLIDAAVKVHDRPIVVPAIVFANAYVPGQELAVHTDVGEFRGANRTVTPQWLIIVMHHSGLFDDHRLRIATAISYFGGGEGGALVYFPDGPAQPMQAFRPRHDSAVVMDTDSIFHGVARVGGDESDVTKLRRGMQLVPGDDVCEVLDADGALVTSYRPDEVRFSVSWKAYCFSDEDDRARWARHDDDLSLGHILAELEADLREQGALEGARPEPDEFGRLLIEHYVRFPEVPR